jgi:hypothetical protein
MNHDVTEMAKGEELLIVWVSLVVTADGQIHVSSVILVDRLKTFVALFVSDLEEKHEMRLTGFSRLQAGQTVPVAKCS